MSSLNKALCLNSLRDLDHQLGFTLPVTATTSNAMVKLWLFQVPTQAEKPMGTLEKPSPEQVGTMTAMYSSIESETHTVKSNSLQSHGLQPNRLLCPWNSPGKNTGVGYHSLLQGIFLTLFIEPMSLVSPALASKFYTTVPPGVLLPGKSHGRRSLEGCSPWGR